LAAGSVDSALDNGSDRDTTPERDSQQTPGTAKRADLLTADGLPHEWGYDAQKQPRFPVQTVSTRCRRHSWTRYRRNPYAYGV